MKKQVHMTKYYYKSLIYIILYAFALFLLIKLIVASSVSKKVPKELPNNKMFIESIK